MTKKPGPYEQHSLFGSIGPDPKERAERECLGHWREPQEGEDRCTDCGMTFFDDQLDEEFGFCRRCHVEYIHRKMDEIMEEAASDPNDLAHADWLAKRERERKRREGTWGNDE